VTSRSPTRILSDDFVNHAELPGLPSGREGVKVLFRAFWSAFPDFRAEIHDMLAERDRVVTRKTFHGTHQGEFMGTSLRGERSRST
jgi:predicted ester cyclase